MIRTLYVFSNCGHLQEIPKSGGQSSSRRVMDGFRDCGFIVVPIRRHRCESESRIGHRLETIVFAIIDSLKVISKLLFGNRRESAFLHLTYAGTLVPLELWLATIVRLLGYKTLEYIKGGQSLDAFRNKSSIYRRLYKITLDMQEVVFFEGLDSLHDAETISKTSMVYFPNYIKDDEIADTVDKRYPDNHSIIYFGRISPGKNVDVIIKVFEILAERDDAVSLTIVGGKGTNTEYVDYIDRYIKNSKFRDRINRHERTPYPEIKRMMQDCRFFIFPSEEKCEGHSNSLNEAMSQGLIPIVSDYHFNRTVVGNDSLVVSGFDPDQYAAVIESHIEKGDLDELSDEMVRKVKEYYSFSRVIPRIREIIMAI